MSSPSTAVPRGAAVERGSVTFGYDDPEHALAGVRLWQEVRVPGNLLEFAWADGRWTLVLARPAVHRMEYLLELRHRDGSRETVLDPANPVRVTGAFGDKSVVEFPDYSPPRWLRAAAPAGSRTTYVTHTVNADDVAWQLWSPPGLDPAEPAPLLLAHDGPEYDHLAELTRYLGVACVGGELPPLRAALLVPGHRDERYSANAAYSRALGQAVVPAIRDRVATTRVVGMGASLGALAMLHLQRRFPTVIDGLFLQSGSFFHLRLDGHERLFARFARIEHFVAEVLRSRQAPRAVPVAMTCGAIEENLANNRLMARALAAQGYPVRLTEVPDVHNYTAWRDAFDPHLADVVREALAG